jgi:pSer/pThr/pTyr-binding forkhead associated (FHA) protein
MGQRESLSVNFLDFQLPSSFDTFDLFILLLRVAFIALVYFFLYQVARVTIRELVTIGTVSAGTQAAAPTLPRAASSLEIIDPAESSLYAGTSLPLEHYTTIGRHDDNTIAIDDGFVSGSHAEMVFDNGGWWLHDLGSTNGTFVNNQAIRSRIRITNGDIIQFGRVQVRAHV